LGRMRQVKVDYTCFSVADLDAGPRSAESQTQTDIRNGGAGAPARCGIRIEQQVRQHTASGGVGSDLNDACVQNVHSLSASGRLCSASSSVDGGIVEQINGGGATPSSGITSAGIGMRLARRLFIFDKNFDKVMCLRQQYGICNITLKPVSGFVDSLSLLFQSLCGGSVDVSSGWLLCTSTTRYGSPTRQLTTVQLPAPPSRVSPSSLTSLTRRSRCSMAARRRA
jgi:hypothetical protein